MRLLIAGAGGHGRVVADLAELTGSWESIAFLDDGSPTGGLSGVWRIEGPLSELSRFRGTHSHFFAAFGDGQLRLDSLARAEAIGFTLATLLHPQAIVSRYAQIGEGSTAFGGAVVSHNARLGKGCVVNTSASVDHDCVLGDGVHVCPGARLAGNVTIGNCVWIGIGASIKQGVSVGDRATIGAGAVCVSDIRVGATVVGVPARERVK